jgi:hypothetical protein
MNERIRELAQQANITIVPEPFDDASRAWNENMKKFAELIVRECASICLDMNYTNPQPHHYAVMIKQHFGVEE